MTANQAGSLSAAGATQASAKPLPDPSVKHASFWSWLWFALGFIYFFLPLFATFEFSLRAQKGFYSFLAYQKALSDPDFIGAFTFSTIAAIATIVFGFLLIVPTAYWVQLRLRGLRPIIEFITLAPFVIPPIILAFGLIK